MLRELLISLAIVARAPNAPTASPSPSPTADLCRPASGEIRQAVTYPDHIEIPASSVDTFRRFKPRAQYGTIVIFTYLEGWVVAKSADRPEFDAAFRETLLKFGSKLAAVPLVAGCAETVGGVFLMIFTIPEGRVRLVPITANEATTIV